MSDQPYNACKSLNKLDQKVGWRAFEENLTGKTSDYITIYTSTGYFGYN